MFVQKTWSCSWPIAGLLAALCTPLDPLLAGAASAQGWDIGQPHASEQVFLDRTVTEGTWMSLDVSPDGRFIVFDLLGHIYEMPIAGGEAKALTSGPSINLMPRYSPDGGRIVFSSDRDGVDNLWVLQRASGKLVNFTRSAAPDRVITGAWSADGKRLYGVVFSEDHLLTPYQFDGYGGRVPLLKPQSPLLDIGNLRDHAGRNVIFFEHMEQRLPAAGARIKTYDKRTGEIGIYVDRPGGAFSPALSPDGRYLSYVHRDDVDTQLILHDLSNREEKVLVRGMDRDRQDTFIDIHGAYPAMGWMPDSRSVVFWNAGGIHVVNIHTGQVSDIPFRARVQRSMDKTIRFKTKIPDGETSTRVHRWPQRIPQGVLFETLGDIYLKTGRQTKNLTHSPAHETSPLYDETRGVLYYASWSDDELGSLHRRKLDGSAARKLTSKPAQYGALALSADGGTLAFLRDDGRLLNGELLHRQTRYDLVLLSLKDGVERRLTGLSWDLTFGVMQLEMPSLRFSPDSRQLYFSEMINTTLSLKRINMDGTEKTELYRFPKGSRAEVSPDGQWIAYQEYQRNYITPFTYVGMPITVSADEGAGASMRIDAAHDGLYHRWANDSRSLIWTRGPKLIEKTVEDVIAGNDRALITPLAVPFQVARPASPIALKGARVITIDPQRRVLENATVLVRGSRIEAIGDAVEIPKDAKVFELQGRTIYPGLIDAHAHLSDAFASPKKMPPLGVIEQRVPELHANLASGVTTLYEVYGTIDKDFWLSDMLLQGSLTGPRLYSTGSALFGSHFLHVRNYRAMRTYEEVLEQVRLNKAFGATALKDYFTQSRRMRQQIAAAARAEGMNLVVEPALDGHGNLSRVIDGATELAHDFPYSSVYDDYVQMYAANGIGITSTLAMEPEYLSSIRSQTRSWEDPKLTRYVRRETLIARMRRPVRILEDELQGPKLAENLKKFYDGGVSIQLGGHGETYGMDMHVGMEAHVRGGQTPMTALAIATIYGARNQGLDDDLGSLQAGKLADLVVVKGNPLQDIRATREIELVMKNGVLYSGEDAARVFPDPRPAGRFYFKRGE